MKDKYFLSIIVPIYNCEQYLDRCINSIVNQKKIDIKWQLILVNDGSSDNSSNICHEYADKYSNIIIIDKANEGVSVARKCGLDKAEGTYVMFVDSDDWLEEDCFNKTLYILLKDQCDMLTFNYNVCFENGIKQERKLSYSGLFSKKDIQNQIFPNLIHNDYGIGYRGCLVCNVFRTDLLRLHMLSDSRAQIGEDGAITISMVYYSDKIYFSSECLYNYYIDNNSSTRSGKIYNSQYPYVINSFIEEQLDMNCLDFKAQIYRKITHDVFNLCCSFFNSKESYMKIRKKIISLISFSYYDNAINKSRFRSVYYNLAKYSLKYRLIFIICLVSKLKTLVLKRLY